MKQLLEFIPLVLFFITYKMFGVRDAAIVLVIATIVQMIVLKLKYGVIEKQQKIMAIAVAFLVYSLPISMKSNIYNGRSPLLMPSSPLCYWLHNSNSIRHW